MVIWWVDEEEKCSTMITFYVCTSRHRPLFNVNLFWYLIQLFLANILYIKTKSEHQFKVLISRTKWYTRLNGENGQLPCSKLGRRLKTWWRVKDKASGLAWQKHGKLSVQSMSWQVFKIRGLSYTWHHWGPRTLYNIPSHIF